MNLKKSISLIVAITLICAGFTACGSKKDSNASTDSSITDSNSSEVIVVPNKPEIEEGSKYDPATWNPYASISDKIKGQSVRYATWGDPYTNEGAVAMANFEADTGLKVEVYAVAQNNYPSTIKTKIAAGDAPDVFMTNSGNQCYPLTFEIASPINRVSTVDLQDPIWDKSITEISTYNGDVYGLNTIGSPHAGSNLVYYNKRLFEENGFKTPEEYYEEGTWTWDNMLKVMRDVVSLSTTEDKYEGAFLDMHQLTGSVGAGIIQYDWKSHTFSSGISDPNLTKAYQWYANARAEGLLNGSINSFTSGKCGIVVNGPWSLKVFGFFKDMNYEDIGYTFLPSFEEGKTGLVPSIHRVYGICEKAPHPDAAGYFIRYWLDPANYDLQNVFLTPEAGNFYYKLINTTADKKFFLLDGGCATLLGESAQDAFYSKLDKVAASDVRTVLDSFSNKVDSSIEMANEIIRNKLDSDRKNPLYYPQ